MSISSSNDVFEAKTFQIVACSHCRLHLRFYRSGSPDIDECGFENYSLECRRCDAASHGTIDPADYKQLLSGTKPRNKTLSSVK
jgi:hypothetical protein